MNKPYIGNKMIFIEITACTNLLHFECFQNYYSKNFHTFSISFILFTNYVSSFNCPCVPLKMKMVYWSTAGLQNFGNTKLPFQLLIQFKILIVLAAQNIKRNYKI